MNFKIDIHKKWDKYIFLHALIIKLYFLRKYKNNNFVKIKNILLPNYMIQSSLSFFPDKYIKIIALRYN